MNRPNKVILHCSASADTHDGEIRFGFEDCKDFHIKERGWRDIGYHWYVDRAGILHKGREENAIGAHCKGENVTSLGVCYEGMHLPTAGQIATLCDLYRQIKSVHGLEWADWRPHSEFANKECPGFPIEDLQRIFKKLA